MRKDNGIEKFELGDVAVRISENPLFSNVSTG